MNVRHPPGRAGRLWLVERLGVARHAADILERKQHALRLEEQRLAHLAAQTASAWVEAVHEAERWHRRAMLLGGRAALQAATTMMTPAAVELVWRVEMGVQFAAEARCILAPAPALPGTTALTSAARAYRHALERAIEHAAADTAHERFRAELAVTEQRLRAVRDRWIPRLESARDDLELSLAEREREELVRSRLDRPDVLLQPDVLMQEER